MIIGDVINLGEGVSLQFLYLAASLQCFSILFSDTTRPREPFNPIGAVTSRVEE
ncbi:MAG: hypothetical protein XD72_2091 [Methanothrix harundinacea]|jgi:hypothetical protein|uniref:Uncharacterized protein n=1 Tax=Methanothrix harundinacea TaxID=301375 RepID=A0A101IFV4_9EURY|nr:MAG: hypothetical protein XD72_2091 [Methanothrix harundinacea]KUK94428.1 MAG: hypothetical protein XE07_2152 [Methanothrix harundinacea]